MTDILSFALLAGGLAVAGTLAMAGAIAWVAVKVRAHRRLLDRRIDILAEESRERALDLDLRLSELTERFETMAREERMDRLFSLLAMAKRGARVSAQAALGLEASLRELQADARAGEE